MIGNMCQFKKNTSFSIDMTKPPTTEDVFISHLAGNTLASTVRGFEFNGKIKPIFGSFNGPS